jgi:hypothetical protein
MTSTPAIAHPRHPIPGEDPEIVRLSEMVMTLLSHVAVLTERLDTVERLLEAHTPVSRDAIESYAPDAAAQAERDAKRRALIATTLRPLRIAAQEQATQPEHSA